MEKVIRESIQYLDRWLSVDGKEFKSEEDCKMWEESYKGTISAGFNQLNKKKVFSSELGLIEDYDYEIYILKIKNLEDLVLLNAWTKINVYESAVISTEFIGEVIYLNLGYDRECMTYGKFSDHIEYILKNAENITRELNEKELNEVEEDNTNE